MVSGITENEWVFTNNGLVLVSDLNMTEFPQVLSYNLETKKIEYKNILAINISKDRHKLKKIIMGYVVQKSNVMFSTDYCLFRYNSDNQLEKVIYSELKQGDRLVSLKTENEIFYPEMWSLNGTQKHIIYDLEIQDNAPFFAGKVVPLLIQKQI